MRSVTFALYDSYPIACEGNDDARRVKVVKVRARANEHIAHRAQKVADWLSRRFNCHTQVWDIA